GAPRSGRGGHTGAAPGRARTSSALSFIEADVKFSETAGLRSRDRALEHPPFQPRPEPQRRHMLMRKRLQPGRLPDAGGWRIKDAFGFLLPELLASRNREVGCRVVGPHHKLVVAGTQHRRDVRAERRVTAFVADHP